MTPAKQSPAVVEQLTEAELGRCKHFTGTQKKVCEAGVEYESVRNGASLPCLRKYNPANVQCPSQCFPTPEDARAKAEERERSMQVTLEGMRRCSKDANGRRGIVGSVECPKCNGTLRYSVASLNGHLWGRCDTAGCLSWMQ